MQDQGPAGHKLAERHDGSRSVGKVGLGDEDPGVSLGSRSASAGMDRRKAEDVLQRAGAVDPGTEEMRHGAVEDGEVQCCWAGLG
jgi:hypothetical protein